MIEDAEVLALCEKYGFGAVMSSASRQWLKRDPIGALRVGECYGTTGISTFDWGGTYRKFLARGMDPADAAFRTDRIENRNWRASQRRSGGQS